MELLKIRKAKTSDEAAVVSCIQKSYQKYIVRIGKKPGPMLDDYLALILDGNVFCGEFGEEIAGVLVLKKFDGYMLLENVALLPEFQGKGFGKQLIAFAEHYSSENNYQEIRLYTNVKMTENIEIYHKLGYSEYSRKEENGFERVYFKKRLIVT
ncbi:GNAT family N-acetyltransferase [Desulfosporosinus sp. PR]|uniref:GNAT family N-acetyltransferase n=1 Tax=Candidatus Desulfosporosinus nitrosoreducens TaxID=3401928 RepID=UPI00280041FF|nr:GNAT family N-acetyltransferase [Desulfosporosinus sp. PR]MDQ7092243.1 GNAT family N-acetyltransferase [Desulfosporosinus sp. PR]